MEDKAAGSDGCLLSPMARAASSYDGYLGSSSASQLVLGAPSFSDVSAWQLSAPHLGSLSSTPKWQNRSSRESQLLACVDAAMVQQRRLNAIIEKDLYLAHKVPALHDEIASLCALLEEKDAALTMCMEEVDRSQRAQRVLVQKVQQLSNELAIARQEQCQEI
eukprot:GEMP01069043.1.p1 GENE.GEMP01069043.1~~GEMP01069043.1.p1  ORF type:complete len:163 (+),score=45.85 GEMP01069043.1:130-618(+)